MKSRIKYIVFGVVLCLIVLYLSNLAECEILTKQHHFEFEHTYKQNTMLGGAEFLKVLEYEECGVAKVYYVSEGYSMGNVLTFAYENGEWNEVSRNTAWSVSGNADKTVYPYLWHWIYFMF